MIHRTGTTLQTNNWQDELKNLIRSPETLLTRLELEPKWLEQAKKASAHFPLKVTESYLSKMGKGNPNDPLLLQVLPLAEELTTKEDYSDDPLEESKFSPVTGIVHKYHGRVLFIATSQCAIHCRYCFRRNFPYDDHKLNQDKWREALHYVAQDDSIKEVILSGGDPLSLGDRQFSWLVKNISAIKHVQRLRIHTRYPVILPSRITSDLLAAITSSRLKPIIVMHCNHPQEIDKHVTEALNRLKKANITLLNQTVLLKNINNDANILATLSEKLFNSGVLPYYLHVLDKTQGTSHFDVPLKETQDVYKELLTILPGYLVPKLVREVPHEGSKTPVSLELPSNKRAQTYTAKKAANLLK